MRWIALLLGLLTTSCFWGDEFDWASRDQIIQVAAACGVESFQPTKVGGAWAAYVPHDVPDWKQKEDCIYEDFERRGLLVTR